jgi:hypothetical protein
MVPPAPSFPCGGTSSLSPSRVRLVVVARGATGACMPHCGVLPLLLVVGVGLQSLDGGLLPVVGDGAHALLRLFPGTAHPNVASLPAAASLELDGARLLPHHCHTHPGMPCSLCFASLSPRGRTPNVSNSSIQELDPSRRYIFAYHPHGLWYTTRLRPA